MNKIFLDKNPTYFLYQALKFSLRVVYVMCLALFVMFLWDQRQTYVSLFEHERLMAAQQFGNWQEYTTLAKFIGWNTLELLVKIFIISLLIGLLNRAPIPTYWLVRWHESGQIQPHLGRALCDHFRAKRFLNLKDFSSLWKLSWTEQGRLNAIRKHKRLSILFKHYDPFYQRDIESK